MKWFWLLFAAYVLTLSAVPCCGDDACCENETELVSAQECGNHNDHEKHGKPELPCSPFFSCNTCHGVVVTANKVILTAWTISTTHVFFSPDSSVLSTYQPAVWHPPKA